MSARFIKKRYLEENNILKTKHTSIVTSTPIKNNTAEKLTLDWISPVVKCSKEPPNPIIPLNEVATAKTIARDSDDENKKSEEHTAKETECIDRICLINNFPNLNNARQVSLSDDDVEKKSKQAKRLIIMNSDEEEEFWRGRNEPKKKRRNIQTKSKKRSSDTKQPRRRKRSLEEVEAPRSEPVVKEKVSNPENLKIISEKIDQNQSETIEPSSKKYSKECSPPAPLRTRKNNAQRLKYDLKVLKKLPGDKSMQDSSPLVFIKPSELAEENGNSGDGENLLRRSKRTKFKPLEFWNGERLAISIDRTSGIETLRDNLKKRSAEVKHINRISRNTQNSRGENKRRTSMTEANKAEKKRQPIFKTRTNTRSRFNVRFSAMGTGTIIDGPTSKKNTKPDWVINFAELHPEKGFLPDSEECVVLPGLNTKKGIISSAVIQLRAKYVIKGRATGLRHLIFCVMEGTVSITIDETTVQMETYGHFVIPCGISYSIKNTAERKAILSYFEVGCSCVQ